MVVAAYWEYTGLCANQDQALDRFAMKRFLDERIGAFQLPSHQRLVALSTNFEGSFEILWDPLKLLMIIILKKLLNTDFDWVRYVEYFSGLLSGDIQVNTSPLYLDHVTVVGVPAFQSNGGCRAFFKVHSHHPSFRFRFFFFLSVANCPPHLHSDTLRRSGSFKMNDEVSAVIGRGQPHGDVTAHTHT